MIAALILLLCEDLNNQSLINLYICFFKTIFKIVVVFYYLNNSLAVDKPALQPYAAAVYNLLPGELTRIPEQ